MHVENQRGFALSDTSTFISELFALDPDMSGAVSFINAWSALQEPTEINATLFIMTIAGRKQPWF